MHTAVKIDPSYRRGQTVYVTDAVARRGRGLQPAAARTRGAGYAADIRAEYEKMAIGHANQRSSGKRLTLAQARANRAKPDFADYVPPAPSFFGTRIYTNYDLAELAQVYRLDAVLPDLGTGRAVSRHPRPTTRSARRRRDLFNDAQEMLKKIIDGKWLTASAVIGFWPANQSPDNVDDIVVYGDKARKFPIQTCTPCASRWRARPGRPNLALSDFIAPVGVEDYIGGFVVTAGIGEDKHIKKFEAAKDDYSAILLRALADRLAEAFAERMHERVRQDYWGYAADENAQQ